MNLYPAPDRPSSYIRKGRKFAGGSVKLRSLVTGVEVSAHKYLPNSESTQLYQGFLEPGEYWIAFDRPAHSPGHAGKSPQPPGEVERRRSDPQRDGRAQ